ncbi:MAG: hypothetical protein ACXAD7_09835, partial [Candidatus Kariarchaeaceae archaeon]
MVRGLIYKKNRSQSKILLLWLLALLVLSLVTVPIQGSKNITEANQMKDQQTSILPDQTGTFENPISLVFAPAQVGENFQEANATSILKRDQPLWFKFVGNESQSIDFTIDVTVDASYNIIFADFFSGEEREHVFASDADFGQFPLEGGYPIWLSGPQFIEIRQLGELSDLPILITVRRILEGEFNPEVETIDETFQANTFYEIENIFTYFIDETSYVIPDGLSVSIDLGDFDQDSPGFGKGIASAIFGLLRAGELIASQRIPEAPPEEIRDLFLPFLDASKSLLNISFDNLLHPTADLFFENDVPLSPPDYVFKLETNAYMLMAMLEVWNFYQHDDYGTADPVEANKLMHQINETMIDIDRVFYNDTYKSFVERVVVLDNDFSAPVHGYQVYLESIALLAEVFYGGLSANFDSQGVVSPQIDALVFNSAINITDYIFTNLITMTDDGEIGVEYFTHPGGPITNIGRANSSTLIANSHLISLYTPVGLRLFPIIELATEIAETTLKKFLSPANGLLFDKVFINDTTKSDTTSTINTGYFLAAIDRLAESWKDEEINFNSALDISRTWSKAVRDLVNNFNEILYDQQTTSYFAQYDHVSNLYIKDDELLETHDFIANAAILDLLSKTFPIGVTLSAPKAMNVDEDAIIFINIEQINPSRKSWLWFQPERKFTVQVKISIPDHNFEETEDIDLNTFDFESGFIDVFFTPLKRGNFKVIIELSVEGTTLLTGKLDAVAFGELYAEFDPVETTSDNLDFSPSFAIFDESGRAVSNLDIDAVIGKRESELNFENDTFSTFARSDSSGKVILEFDDILQNFTDGIIGEDDELKFYELVIFINITNAASLKYNSPIHDIPISVRKNFIE